MSSITTELPPVVAEHIAAVNAFDTDRIVNTFAPDAYVNDNQREIWGAEAIRKFMDKERPTLVPPVVLLRPARE